MSYRVGVCPTAFRFLICELTTGGSCVAHSPSGNTTPPRMAGKEATMVQAEKQYKVVRATPRKGELYAVKNLRTGVTTIKTADRNFRRDTRRVFVLTGDTAA